MYVAVFQNETEDGNGDEILMRMNMKWRWDDDE